MRSMCSSLHIPPNPKVAWDISASGRVHVMLNWRVHVMLNPCLTYMECRIPSLGPGAIECMVVWSPRIGSILSTGDLW